MLISKRYFGLLIRMFFSIAYISMTVNCFSQIVPPNPASIGSQFCLNNIIPPSPDACSLEKWANVNVNLYCGRPNIDIPIWEVKGKSISIPISISYNSSGIKVEDEASCVGMGWTLNAGGSISRTVIGLSDELPGRGYFHCIDSIPEGMELYNYDNYSYNFCKRAATGKIDLEPDLFSFSYPNNSGQFVFDKYDEEIKPFLVPHQNIEVRTNQGLTCFSIVDEGGIIYNYGCELNPNLYKEETCIIYDPSGTEQNFVSTWHLTNITNPVSQESIELIYESNNENFVRISNQTISLLMPNNCAPHGCNIYPTTEDMSTCFKQTYHAAKKIKSISSLLCTIDFSYSDREDLDGGRKLDSIRIVENITQTVVKKFRFYYSYTGSGQTNEFIKRRLWLDSLREESGSEHKTSSFLYYNRSSLPPKDSFSQDHWGFYNGAQNTSLIPTFTTYEPITYDGADREPDTSYITYGLLQQITYPTGGFTKFLFESHDFYENMGQNIQHLITVPQFLEIADENRFGPPFNDDTTSAYIFLNLPQSVQVNLQITNIDPLHQECNGEVYIYDSTNTQIWWASGGCVDDSYWVPLDEGVYKVSAYAMAENRTSVRVDWENLDTTLTNPINYNTYGGGVRLKKMISNDGKQNHIKEYLYVKTNDPQKSSGVLVGRWPSYIFTSKHWFFCPPDDPPPYPSYCTYFNCSSNSNRILGMTNASHVGYKEVTELDGENGENGRILYRYTFENDHGTDCFPYPPHTSNEWKRGLLLEQKTYDASLTLKQCDTYTYQFNDNNGQPNFNSIEALKIGSHDDIIWDPNFCSFIIEPYNVYAGWKYNYKKTTLKYDENGLNPIIDSVRYGYSPSHLQVTKMDQWNSNGDQFCTTYKYPSDFDFSGQPTDQFAEAIVKMRDEFHMHDRLIEQHVTSKSFGNVGDIAGKLNLYRYLESQYNSEPPIVLTRELEYFPGLNSPNLFSESTINSNGEFEYDGNYLPRIHYDLYDSYGNLLQYHKEGDIPVSFNYGFNNSLLITHAINATYDPTNTYSGNSSQVTRYDYYPLIGIKTITDPRNVKTKYFYDDLGRLKLIINDDGNILKKMDYHLLNNQAK